MGKKFPEFWQKLWERLWTLHFTWPGRVSGSQKWTKKICINFRTSAKNLRLNVKENMQECQNCIPGVQGNILKMFFRKIVYFYEIHRFPIVKILKHCRRISRSLLFLEIKVYFCQNFWAWSEYFFGILAKFIWQVCQSAF